MLNICNMMLFRNVFHTHDLQRGSMPGINKYLAFTLDIPVHYASVCENVFGAFQIFGGCDLACGNFMNFQIIVFFQFFYFSHGSFFCKKVYFIISIFSS